MTTTTHKSTEEIEAALDADCAYRLNAQPDFLRHWSDQYAHAALALALLYRIRSEDKADGKSVEDWLLAVATGRGICSMSALVRHFAGEGEIPVPHPQPRIE